jgi:hypothetical protein
MFFLVREAVMSLLRSDLRRVPLERRLGPHG